MTLQICRKHFFKSTYNTKKHKHFNLFETYFSKRYIFCCYFKLNKYVITDNLNFLDIKLKKRFYATLIFQTE